MLELDIKATAESEESLDVTSAHLEVIPPGAMYDEFTEEGDELTKRVERFGFPLGKGVYFFRYLDKCFINNCGLLR